MSQRVETSVARLIPRLSVLAAERVNDVMSLTVSMLSVFCALLGLSKRNKGRSRL